jgi:hypothetical protein
VHGGDVAGVVTTAGDESAADLVGRKVLVDPAIYRDDTAQAPPSPCVVTTMAADVWRCG